MVRRHRAAGSCACSVAGGCGLRLAADVSPAALLEPLTEPAVPQGRTVTVFRGTLGKLVDYSEFSRLLAEGRETLKRTNAGAGGSEKTVREPIGKPGGPANSKRGADRDAEGVEGTGRGSDTATDGGR